MALVAVSSLALMGACSSGKGGEGTTPGAAPEKKDITLSFQWWGNDDRASVTQEVVELYEKNNPGVKIQTSFAPDANYWEKMATQVAGGNAPDVFQMKLEFFQEYQARGVIKDLSEFTSGDSPVIATSDMLEQYLAAGVIDGATYGVPTGRSTQAFFYDPKVWQEYGLSEPAVGWTWEDLEAAGEIVKEKSGGDKVIMSDIGNEQPWFESWLLPKGKSIYTKDGELNFTQEDLEDFWTFTQDMSKSGIFTSASVTTSNDRTMATSPLVKGQSLGEINDVSLSSAYFQSFGEVRLAPIPQHADGIQGASYAGVTQLLVVSENSPHPEEAAKFIDFFLNDLEAGAILGITRGMPANEAILAKLAANFDEGDKATYAFEQTVGETLLPRPPVAPEGGSQNLLDFKNGYDRVIFDQETPAVAAANVFKKFQDNISK